jgi:hypothetical protein
VKIYHLYRRQHLDLTTHEAWSFFSSPYNLNDITPEFFHVTITSKVPEKIYAGLMISYQVKAVLGIFEVAQGSINSSHCHLMFLALINHGLSGIQAQLGCSVDFVM